MFTDGKYIFYFSFMLLQFQSEEEEEGERMCIPPSSSHTSYPKLTYSLEVG